MMAMLLALAAATDCRHAAVPIAEGEVVDGRNTAPGGCATAPIAPKLRYDRRAGVVRAKAALAAGEPLGRILIAPRPRVLAGEKIAVTARLGSVTVSRTATALQPARAGASFFARGDDGTIFVAPAFAEEAR